MTQQLDRASERNPADNEHTRRGFLRAAATTVGGLTLAGGLLAACGSSSSGSTAAKAASGASSTPISFQLSWLENVEFAGSYIAKSNGLYSANGLDVSLQPGGPTVEVEPLIAAAKSLIGLSSIVPAITAITKGADLRIIGAQYQTTPFVMLSLAKAPIRTPKDMVGKKIGVASDNQAIWKAFLGLNGLSLSQVTTVPEQFDPSPLAAGEVDGWLGFSTDEQVALVQKGVKIHSFSLADYGYRVLDSPYLVQASTLQNASQRKLIVDFMKAERAGWQRQMADPASGTKLAVDTYGKSQGLSMTEQLLSAKAQNKLFTSADTQTNGLFWMTPARQQQTAKTLAAVGIKFNPADVFSLDVLKEANAA